jgi:pimeloyl-ACP methyl ester carboxylesterase
MPGYGRAEKPEHFDYTVEGYAGHLGSALMELRIRCAHLVLHNFGGLWGLAWAAAHPDAFASAVLINTGAWLDYHWRPYARMWRTPLLGELSRVMATRAFFHLFLKLDSPRGLPAAYINQMYVVNDLRSGRIWPPNVEHCPQSWTLGHTFLDKTASHQTSFTGML